MVIGNFSKIGSSSLEKEETWMIVLLCGFARTRFIPQTPHGKDKEWQSPLDKYCNSKRLPCPLWERVALVLSAVMWWEAEKRLPSQEQKINCKTDQVLVKKVIQGCSASLSTRVCDHGVLIGANWRPRWPKGKTKSATWKFWGKNESIYSCCVLYT